MMNIALPFWGLAESARSQQKQSSATTNRLAHQRSKEFSPAQFNKEPRCRLQADMFPARRQLLCSVRSIANVRNKSQLPKSTHAEKLHIRRAPNLERLTHLVHGFSTRLGGFSSAYGGRQLNLGFTAADTLSTVERNRLAFLQALAWRPLRDGRKPAVAARSARSAATPLVTLRQIHSGIVHIIGKNGRLPEGPLRGDGMITDQKDILLGIQVADCVPVLVADRRGKAVGAFHAGWRGTAKRIVERGVGAMRAIFGCEPEDLLAAIGPCIHACCYAVGDEVIDEFQSQFAYTDDLFTEVYDRDPIKEKYPLLFLTARAPGHSNIGPQIHLDLIEANRRQLLDAGVRAKNIWAAEECTSCRTDLLFSHRAEAGYTGRMMAAIGLAK
jgi:polyphenol oxidase